MNGYGIAADFILVVHAGFVAFVVVGLVVIWVGYFLEWRFVRSFLFRLLHLAAIAFVAAEAIFGMTCPLTTWENQLRVRSGATPYAESFMEHWVGRLMFYDCPAWTFTIAYCAFLGLVALSWWIVKPGRRATGGA